MGYKIITAQEFAAAHKIADYPGDCGQIHGHTWKVEVTFSGNELNDLGMLFDFREAKQLLIRVLSDFDHKLINDIPPFDSINPTAENLANYFYTRLKQEISDLCRLQEVKVWESQYSCAVYSEDF